MLKVRIVSDDNPQDPRENDNAARMICFHKKYSLGDKHDYRSGDYNGWDELWQAVEEKEGPILKMKLLHMYEHSGITIKTGSFSDRWDSGQIGFVFVTKRQCELDYGGDRTPDGDLGWAERIIEGEVDEYDKYLRGDAWGFEVYDDEDPGHVLESCYGFLGDDYCREEAESALENYIAQAEADAFEAEEKSWEDMGALLEATAA
jgi:hypothetical protein